MTALTAVAYGVAYAVIWSVVAPLMDLQPTIVSVGLAAGFGFLAGRDR